MTCSTTSISLTATGGDSYRWDDNSTNDIRTVSSSGTYSVTVTGTNGCTATASSTIFSSTVLTTSVTASVSVASIGSVISLTALGGATYQWSNPTGALFTSSVSTSVVSASLVTVGPQVFTVVIG